MNDKEEAVIDDSEDESLYTEEHSSETPPVMNQSADGFEWCDIHNVMYMRGDICPACDAEEQEAMADAASGSLGDAELLQSEWEMEECHGASLFEQPDAPEMPEDIRFPEVE